MSVSSASNGTIFHQEWGGLSWSPWLDLADSHAFTDFNQPGLYRVRVEQSAPLLYIGESRNLKGRIATLRNGGCHAALALIQFLETFGTHSFEVSVALSIHDRTKHPVCLTSSRHRESVERYLMWRHRVQTGSSALCAHGRCADSRHRLLTSHSERDTPDVSTPGIQPSSCALPAVGHPADQYWMGLQWSPLFQFPDVRKRYSSRLSRYFHYGLYKVLDLDCTCVLYIGYASDVWGQAQKKFRKWGFQPRDAVVSVHPLLSGIPRTPFLRYRCFERRDDLLGGHHHQFGRPPKFQF